MESTFKLNIKCALQNRDTFIINEGYKLHLEQAKKHQKPILHKGEKSLYPKKKVSFLI